jgi:hypothetical protein
MVMDEVTEVIPVCAAVAEAWWCVGRDRMRCECDQDRRMVGG